MYCPNCGIALSENAKFCPKCGAVLRSDGGPGSPAEDPVRPPRQEYTDPVRDDEASGSVQKAGQANGKSRCAGNTCQETNTNRSAENTRQGTGSAGGSAVQAAEEKPGKKRTGLVVGIIAAAVVVIGAAAALFFTTRDTEITVNLDRYLTISEKGFDGHGTASFEINTDKLEEDYAGRIKSSSDTGSYSLISSDTADTEENPVTMLIDGIGGSLDRDSGLSNGDVIHFTWSVDSGIEVFLDVNLKYTDTDHTVKDLAGMTTYDVFDDVYMSYSGTEPEGEAALHVNPGSLLPLTVSDFIVNKTTGLSDGETVTVTLLDEADDTLADAGYIAENRTKQYTVEDLAHYASSHSEISEDALMELRSAAENANHPGSDAGLDSIIDEFDFLGYYFLNSRFDDGNKLYLIYRTTITTSNDGGSKTFDQFTYICYYDGIIEADGTFIINEDDLSVPEYEEDPLFGGVTGEGFSYEVGGKDYECGGFQTLGELYETDIAQQLNMYTVETTVEQ